MNEVSSDVSPSNLIVMTELFQDIALPKGKKETLVSRQTKPTCFAFSPKTQFSLACATIFIFFWLATNLIVLQREKGVFAPGTAVRGLEVWVLRASNGGW